MGVGVGGSDLLGRRHRPPHLLQGGLVDVLAQLRQQVALLLADVLLDELPGELEAAQEPFVAGRGAFDVGEHLLQAVVLFHGMVHQDVVANRPAGAWVQDHLLDDGVDRQLLDDAVPELEPGAVTSSTASAVAPVGSPMPCRLPGPRAGHPGAVAEMRRTIRARPEQVWEVLADPTTYPSWLVGAQVIRSVDAEFPSPGSDFHHEVGANDKATIPDRTTALDADPPHSLSLKVRARPLFEGIVRFRLVATKSGTELVLEEEPVGPLRFLAPVLRPLIQARNAKSLDNLRDLVESRTSP
jgi:uncharacterized protein YndB with AHSA1/START domain